MKTASEWADSIGLSMVNGEAAINIGSIAGVIALAQAEARREALKEVARILIPVPCCDDCARGLSAAARAIRALAAKVQP